MDSRCDIAGLASTPAENPMTWMLPSSHASSALGDALRPRRLLTRAIRWWCGLNPTQRRRMLVRNVLRRWCVDEEIETFTPYGFRMAASPRNYCSYGVYFFGELNRDMSTVVSTCVRPGFTAWDVGAERGWFTLLMARLVGPTGRVDAFEAFPGNFRLHQANVARNGFHWVRSNPVAVSRGDGRLWFIPPSSTVTHHISELDDCSGTGHLSREQTPEAIEVPTISLDSYAERTGLERLDFIKMDIEGAEVDALHGAERVLTRFRPAMTIEYNREALSRAGYSLEELDLLLDGFGYERFLYRRGFKPLDLTLYADKPDSDVVLNVYCFPRKSR